MKKIAIVEDNPDNMLLVQAILGSNYELATYVNGPTALSGIPDSGVDLVLLDISLPGMDGVEVLQRIRKDERMSDLPVIALTAHAMVGDREKFLSKGFNDYLSKPILDMDAFKALVDSYLN